MRNNAPAPLHGLVILCGDTSRAVGGKAAVMRLFSCACNIMHRKSACKIDGALRVRNGVRWRPSKGAWRRSMCRTAGNPSASRASKIAAWRASISPSSSAAAGTRANWPASAAFFEKSLFARRAGRRPRIVVCSADRGRPALQPAYCCAYYKNNLSALAPSMPSFL